MKLLALILTAAALAACQKPTAENAGQPPENGAQYKKDKGLALTDAMKKAIALKVATEFNMVINLTVEYYMVTAAGRSHWLMASSAEIDNRQAPVAQHYALSGPDTLVIWPAVREQTRR